MKFRKPIILPLAVLLAACSTASAQPLAKVEKPKAVSFEEQWARELPEVSESYRMALRDFSYRSTALLLDGKTNRNYSPVSLYEALSLASMGASGETAEEMRMVLGSLPQSELDSQAPLLYNNLYFNNKVGKLMMASSIWADPSVKVNSDFADQAAKLYYAQSYQVDFSKPEAQKAINDWVKNETAGLIQETQAPEEGTILSILQTVCFMDEWMSTFNVDGTKEDRFMTEDGEVQCAFMNSTDSCGEVYESQTYLRSSLLFKNGAVMTFVLPKDGYDVTELVKDEATLKDALEGGESKMGEIIWHLPKFTMNSSLNLVDPLKQLGMNLAFTGNAEFTNLLEGDEAFISGVSQETMIEVDEKGAKAAASTRLDFSKTALMTEVFHMTLDKPFMYAIEYQGVLLFVGVLADPMAK